jgi:hypothetical protein
MKMVNVIRVSINLKTKEVCNEIIKAGGRIISINRISAFVGCRLQDYEIWFEHERADDSEFIKEMTECRHADK